MFNAEKVRERRDAESGGRKNEREREEEEEETDQKERKGGIE